MSSKNQSLSNIGNSQDAIIPNTILSAMNNNRADVRGLASAEQRLAEISSIRRVKAGELIYFEGDKAEWIYQIVSGSIREYNVMEDGRRQVVDFYSTGEFFGLSEVPCQYHTAEAIQDTTIRCFPRDATLGIICQQPQLAKALIESVMLRLHRARERMILLGRMGALQRVATFLVHQFPEQKNGAKLRLTVSRQDIADYLGLTIETVCRSFTQLKAADILEMKSARELTIIDFPALTALSHGHCT